VREAHYDAFEVVVVVVGAGGGWVMGGGLWVVGCGLWVVGGMGMGEGGWVWGQGMRGEGKSGVSDRS
jgi:hypothetical protein